VWKEGRFRVPYRERFNQEITSHRIQALGVDDFQLGKRMNRSG